MSDIEQRLTVLEIKQDRILADLEKNNSQLGTHIHDDHAVQKAMLAKLTSIETTQAKQKGFWGGVLFAASAFWAVLGGVLTIWIKAKSG